MTTPAASESLGPGRETQWTLPAFWRGERPGKAAELTVARVPKLEFLNASNSSVILEAKAWR